MCTDIGEGFGEKEREDEEKRGQKRAASVFAYGGVGAWCVRVSVWEKGRMNEAMKRSEKEKDWRVMRAAYVSNLLGGENAVVRVDGTTVCVEVAVGKREMLMRVLRDHTACQYTSLTDVTAVHYPLRAGSEFDVVYQRLSVRYGTRLRVTTRVGEMDVVPSMVSVFPSANWCEREVWDLFGVVFAGHPDRRRLLTDYGFEGHPMRKEFPTEGYTQVRYDLESKRVVCEESELSQGARFSTYASAWKQVPSRRVVRPSE